MSTFRVKVRLKALKPSPARQNFERALQLAARHWGYEHSPRDYVPGRGQPVTYIGPDPKAHQLWNIWS